MLSLTGGAEADGGDSPAWSRRRTPYEPPEPTELPEPAGRVPYAELHCHSNFSFLDGASHRDRRGEGLPPGPRPRPNRLALTTELATRFPPPPVRA